MALVRFTPDLFEPPTAEPARRQLTAAFGDWIASVRATNQIRRASSAGVYESMWEAFADWCVTQDPVVTLDNLTDLDLRRFLGQRKADNDNQLTDRHAWRVLTLIDRVQAHRAARLGIAPSAAAAVVFRDSQALRQANLVDKPALDYLKADQAARLVNHLRAARPGANGPRKLAGWQELRNLAAVALHIGAGLTPGDVRALSLEAPQSDGKRIRSVKVPENGNRIAREAPVARWAAEVLDFWLKERSNAGMPDRPVLNRKGEMQKPLLFPARGGAPWSKVAHYEAVQKVLEAAEIETGLGSTGGLRLRHTFAVRQLKQGKSAEEVARYMGISNPAEMARYQAVLGADDEVV